jgi:hypothetical protein
MANALANHGYLACDRLDVSMADLIFAFNASVNLASTATQLVGAKALLTTTTGDATTFNLDDLNTHGSELTAIYTQKHISGFWNC